MEPLPLHCGHGIVDVLLTDICHLLLPCIFYEYTPGDYFVKVRPVANRLLRAVSGSSFCLFMKQEYKEIFLLCFRHQLMEEARFPLVEPLGVV
jgi:hypothetical protein